MVMLWVRRGERSRETRGADTGIATRAQRDCSQRSLREPLRYTKAAARGYEHRDCHGAATAAPRNDSGDQRRPCWRRTRSPSATVRFCLRQNLTVV
jgi:hypothetical protein